ncbi:MAG TPA: sigma-70 family RNA polymerase sigma factor [Steroidobacteraceae bacterium]|nr:sigma-70 family RNA polymerase sigma factor [Steroidobacteraceae bacterium]
MAHDPTQATAAAADAAYALDLIDPQPAQPPAADASHHAYVTMLFNRHRASLQHYLMRLVPADDAAELVQESYYRLLRHGEMVRIDAMARSFLFQTATNLARDHHRRRASHRAALHVPIDGEEIPEDHRGPDQQLAGEQTRALLEEAIAALPPDTRTVFVLHRFRDLTYPQIAGLMNLSARTVARKMAEAIERLSTAMAEAK